MEDNKEENVLWVKDIKIGDHIIIEISPDPKNNKTPDEIDKMISEIMGVANKYGYDIFTVSTS